MASQPWRPSGGTSPLTTLTNRFTLSGFSLQEIALVKAQQNEYSTVVLRVWNGSPPSLLRLPFFFFFNHDITSFSKLNLLKAPWSNIFYKKISPTVVRNSLKFGWGCWRDVCVNFSIKYNTSAHFISWKWQQLSAWGKRNEKKLQKKPQLWSHMLFHSHI